VQGKVRSIAPTVDPQTRNALVYVDLPNMLQNTGPSAARPPEGASTPLGGSAVREATSMGAVKAGMFARGDFQLGRNNALTVPQAAIVPRDGFNHLMVLQGDNRVSALKVETGRRVGDRVEITTQLPPDARVVVQGAGFLNDGDLVRVVEAGAPTAAAGASATAAPVAVK
jgi:multidrug efflux pump subunit AcrA (membrane-fusion protein)